MATPRKLPSGMYRCQVYDYTDENGKRHYRSFTDPNKKICQLMAADFIANKKRRSQGNLTVSEAVEEYIKVKEAVLSPATIRGYKVIQRNHFKSIEHLMIKNLTNQQIQQWVSRLSVKLAPKTVANAHGLLNAVLDMYAPEIHLNTKLPRKQHSSLYVPSDSDIQLLLESVRDTELEKAILLAAFGPLRRGEICALTEKDISGNIVSVTKSMVKDINGKWHIKDPKTPSSYRTIELPDPVIKRLIPTNGRIVDATPDIITKRFEYALKKTGLHPFRFHDLRHYFVSISHAMNIPDQYIQDRGGWATDTIMKTHYRGSISDEAKKMNDKMNNHFVNISHEMQHDTSGIQVI